jgi:hypothetical protein
MSDHDRDAALRLTLKRHRAFATGLLIAMAALILFSYQLPPGYWTEMLQAAAKACPVKQSLDPRIDTTVEFRWVG